MTVAEMSRVDLTSDGWASSGGDAGESGDGIWRSYRTNHRPGWHPTCAAFRAVRTVTSEADAPVGDLPGHYRRLATDIPLPGGDAAHSPLAWPITGNLLASDDPRGLREDLRPHVPPTVVGFLIALAVHLAGNRVDRRLLHALLRVALRAATAPVADGEVPDSVRGKPARSGLSSIAVRQQGQGVAA